MSVSAVDNIDSIALDKSDVGPFEFSKEVMGSRPFFVISIPKVAYDICSTVYAPISTAFKLSEKILDDKISGFFTKLGNYASVESVIALFQDVVLIPSEFSTFNKKVVCWISGKESLSEAAHGLRKFSAHISSTVSDCIYSVTALSDLSPKFKRAIPLLKDDQTKILEKVGAYTSIYAASSKIYDYVTGRIESTCKHNLTPSARKVRSQLESSRNFYDVVRDVSVIALGVLVIYKNGMANVPGFLGAALAGVVLGSRLVSFYREVQIKKIDDAHPSIEKAQKQLKA